jgi:hypothetical protein
MPRNPLSRWVAPRVHRAPAKLPVLVRVAAATAVVVSFALAQPVDAASRELQRQAKQMADTAAKLFAKKEYREAAKLFEQAYALDNGKAVRLRNAGRAFEEFGDKGNALRCFEVFIKHDVGKKFLTDANTRIKKLRDAGVKPTRADGSPLEPVAPKPALKPVVKPKPAVAKLEQSATSRGGPNWMVTGAGAVVLATGAGWLVMTLGAESETENSGKYDYEGGSAKLADDQAVISTNKTVAYALIGAGALTAAAGVFLLRGKPDPKPMASSELTPYWTRGGGGLRATLRF